MTLRDELGSPALRYLYDRYIGGNKRREAAIRAELARRDIALQIYELRTQAGLTQRQLARRIGTTASVICRLEDADYPGHSLAMLRRIAAALGQEVQVRFVPGPQKRTRA
jgi:ribosome-binding protein aMBF1 (putative translation factor)